MGGVEVLVGALNKAAANSEHCNRIRPAVQMMDEVAELVELIIEFKYRRPGGLLDKWVWA